MHDLSILALGRGKWKHVRKCAVDAYCPWIVMMNMPHEIAIIYSIHDGTVGQGIAPAESIAGLTK